MTLFRKCQPHVTSHDLKTDFFLKFYEKCVNLTSILIFRAENEFELKLDYLYRWSKFDPIWPRIAPCDPRPRLYLKWKILKSFYNSTKFWRRNRSKIETGNRSRNRKKIQSILKIAFSNSIDRSWWC